MLLSYPDNPMIKDYILRHNYACLFSTNILISDNST